MEFMDVMNEFMRLRIEEGDGAGLAYLDGVIAGGELRNPPTNPQTYADKGEAL